MISFHTTQNKKAQVALKEAVLQGLAEDGGLFMPSKLTRLPSSFFRKLPSLTFPEIAYEVASHLLQGAIPDGPLREIISSSMTFDAPLVKLSKGLYTLELFHGPTLSFKDFGARFMAQLMGYYAQGMKKEIHILTATSGDTGSAVAHGFYDVPGIRVWILYPSEKITPIQELQLTTMGRNIHVLEVEGCFDDCQAMAKEAFRDQELRQKLFLTSANSINIARLIPQSFYYFSGYAQLKAPFDPVVFSVPSGNFGNLVAGLLAKRLGLPIEKFVAATNINDSVPKFLETGVFESHPSWQTLSNAMDVGNPSNFARLLDLYGSDLSKIRKDLYGVRFTDAHTVAAILEVWKAYRYVLDPHGAVAYLGLKAYQELHAKTTGIFLETAHPAKFPETVEPIVGKVAMPQELAEVLTKKKHTTRLPNRYSALKKILLT